MGKGSSVRRQPRGFDEPADRAYWRRLAVLAVLAQRGRCTQGALRADVLRRIRPATASAGVPFGFGAEGFGGVLWSLHAWGWVSRELDLGGADTFYAGESDWLAVTALGVTVLADAGGDPLALTGLALGAGET